MTTPTPSNPLSLRVPQIAAQTGLSVDFIRDQINAGALPARKAGRAIVVLPGDVDAWLQGLPKVEAKGGDAA